MRPLDAEGVEAGRDGPSGAAPPHVHDVVIIGAGFAGLCAAIRMRQDGWRDVVVLEASDRLGGTWRDNTYPGCACDVASHLYSLSFAPKADWSRHYGGQEEILAYLEACADRFGVRPAIRFGAEVRRLAWVDAADRWAVELRDGGVLHARQVVSATGPLNRPALPEVPGQGDFRGPSFHSMHWDHRVDLQGKRVAVVGTGASAIQIVPAIADQVGELLVFQRTAPWVLPKGDGPIPRPVQALFRWGPLRWLHRQWLYWRHEAKALAFLGSGGARWVAEGLARRHLRRELGDRPALLAKATPRFAMGCKRVLLSNDWYPTLRAPRVRLIADGVGRVEAEGLRGTDGTFYPVDVIVWATGYQVADALLPMEVIGPRGRRLAEVWEAEGAPTYLGVATPGFPNLWFLVGPNTGLGHNSIIFMIESQVSLIRRALARLRRRGGRRIEVRRGAQRRFARWLDARMARTVWLSGCRSWYLDRRGRNTTLWPSWTWRYWLATRLPRWRAFRWDGGVTAAWRRRRTSGRPG